MIQGSLSISLQGVKAAALPIDARKSTVLRSNASEHAKNARVLKHSGRLGKVALHKKAVAAKPPVSGATSPFLAALLQTNATQQTPVRTAPASVGNAHRVPRTSSGVGAVTLQSEIAHTSEQHAKPGTSARVSAYPRTLLTQSAAREMPIAQESNSVIGVNVLQKFVAKTMPLGREQPGVVVQQSANASLLTHPLKRSGQQAHSLTAALQSDQIQGIEKPSVSSAFIASAQGGGVQAGVKRANHSNVSTSSAESGGALAPGLGVRRTYPSALGLITSAKVHGSSTNQTGAAIASQGVSALQIALQQAKSMKRLPRTVHTGAATMQANMIRLHAILPLRSPQRHGMIAVAMERPSLPHPVTVGFVQSGTAIQNSPVAWSELGKFLQSKLQSSDAQTQVTVQLTLHPAHLGQVNVIMDVRASQHVNVQLVAANADAKLMIQTHRAELIQQLTQGGFVSVHVDVRQEQGRASAHAERPLTVTKNRSPIVAASRASSYQEQFATGFYAEG